jgi:hypothetical protein
MTFLLSGILHACVSQTLAGSTGPWTAFVAFALQPFGTSMEAAAGRSRSWRAIGHFDFTLSWLVLTFPFLVDDLARSGIWFTEPLPFSLLRWMGISREKKYRNCWCGYDLASTTEEACGKAVS